jgi:hypothetical protein
MKSKWPEFLLTIGLRLISGAIVGSLAGLLLGYKLILRSFARDNVRLVALWLGLWGLGGAIIWACRVPYWQTPWYKGLHSRDDDLNEDQN